MKRLVAVISSVVVVLAGVAGASPAGAAGWDYPTPWTFGIVDAINTPGSVTVTGLRVDNGTVHGFVEVSQGNHKCSGYIYGAAASFTIDSYSACAGFISFTVDGSGALTSSTALTISGASFSGGATAQGTKNPPDITCTATLNGSTSIDVAWTPGAGATSYDITANPTLPAAVNVSAGPNAITVPGLALGTTYAFTVKGLGSTSTEGTCSARTADQPTPPTGGVTLGVITGSDAQHAEREYTLSAGTPPTGWDLTWISSNGHVITPHGSASCGVTFNATPQWTRAGSASVVGAPLTVNVTCFVPIPDFVLGTISGTDVTVNYAFSSAYEPGTIVMASYHLTSGGPDQVVNLGSPPGNGPNGAGTFAVTALKPGIGVVVRLYATNGPAESGKGGPHPITNPVLKKSLSYDPADPAANNATWSVDTVTPISLSPGFDPPSWHPDTFSLIRPLPAGLILDPRTGVISGTALTAAPLVQAAVRGVDSSTSPPTEDYTVVTFVITQGVPGSTTTPSVTSVPSVPSSVPSGDGASTGSAGGSSGSTGSGGATTSACLAPNGNLYTDFAGSVDSTLTMAANTFGMPTPTSFAVTKGSLPIGVWLDGAYGVISGTPTRSNGGSGAVEITTTWPDGSTRVTAFNIAIDDPHHAVNYPNRVIGSTGQSTAVTPLPINAVGAKRFELVCGTLPAGTSMNPRTGVISGTPTTLDERPMPLRVRMTDAYGWVDASMLFVVNNGVTPWMRYPEFAPIGIGRVVRIVPTVSGFPRVGHYVLVGLLPKGLSLNARTGVISGRSVVVNHLVYEPTIVSFGPDDKRITTTVPSMTVIKPAVPMKVTARFANRAVPKGTTVVVTNVKHPSYVVLSAKVVCSKCSYTFSKKTGKVVVTTRKGATRVTVTVVGQPRTPATRAAYAGHTWTRTWAVAHAKK
ncbi:MAG: putative Ig domain-containing protein [Actinomycetes bacterium]